MNSNINSSRTFSVNNSKVSDYPESNVETSDLDIVASSSSTMTSTSTDVTNSTDTFLGQTFSKSDQRNATE